MSDIQERTVAELRALYATELDRLGVLQREYFAAEKAHKDQCALIRELRENIDARSKSSAEKEPTHG